MKVTDVRRRFGFGQAERPWEILISSFKVTAEDGSILAAVHDEKLARLLEIIGCLDGPVLACIEECKEHGWLDYVPGDQVGQIKEVFSLIKELTTET